MPTVMRRYNFKLYPTTAQAAAIDERRRLVALLWNAALQQRLEAYARCIDPQTGKGKSLTAYDQGKELGALVRECPEFAALTRSTMERTLNLLDDAYKAFFRRMKELSSPGVYEVRAAEFIAKRGRRPTRYELAGFPQFKRTAEYPTLPFREMCKAGWRLTPRDDQGKSDTRPVGGADLPNPAARGRRMISSAILAVAQGTEGALDIEDDSARASGANIATPRNRGESRDGLILSPAATGGQTPAQEAPRACGEEGGHRGARRPRPRAPRACGEEGDGEDHPLALGEAPRACGEEGWKRTGPRSWRLYIKGVPGLIRARGKFPAQPERFRNCDVIYRDGEYWLSICVDVPIRREAGGRDTTVRFDLIDEFARVERAEGPMSGQAERPNQTSLQGDKALTADVSPETGFGDRRVRRQERQVPADVSPETGFGDRVMMISPRSCRADVSPETGSGDRLNYTGTMLRLVDVAPETGSEHRVHADEGIAAILDRCRAEDEKASDLAAERDQRFRKGSYNWRAWSRRIAGLKGRAARRRREALHRWTTSVVAGAASLTIVSPPIRDNTRTGKGNERQHGAAVQTVADVNRHVLGQAPAAAIQMLSYKAAEAGLFPIVVSSDDHKIAIGQEVATAAKAVRKVRRQLKKAKV